MVTISEIAKAVGVSSATVSRVLNFDLTLSVTADTRRSIIEKAEALNYETPRNRSRKAERNVGKIALVHFLSPDQELVDPYYVALRLGVERRCQRLHHASGNVLYPSQTASGKGCRSASSLHTSGIGAVLGAGSSPFAWGWLRFSSSTPPLGTC